MSTTTVAGDLVSFTRHALAGLRMLLAFTLVLGLGYPLVVTGISQIAMPWQANGSLLRADGTHADRRAADVVGSALIGQGFEGEEWFHPRPSAAGEGYDTLASAGSNLGPLNHDLVAAIEERRAAVAQENGVDPADVPADALTASASGLDPHISPDYAEIQVARVAQARGLSDDVVAGLVADHTAGRDLGVLGEPRVNVLELNLALAALAGAQPAGAEASGAPDSDAD